ncbi:MAG: hypothetical protein V1926_00900, partial [Candidatus Peregrinibacteria bacterium]
RSYMAGVRDGRLVGEACDDGNHFNMDGCSAGSVVNIGCTVESGWTCTTGEPSVCTFDSGSSSSSSASPLAGVLCGDGTQQRAGRDGVLDTADDEECDAGSGNGQGSCTVDCKLVAPIPF